jgi:hypothetical protein
LWLLGDLVLGHGCEENRSEGSKPGRTLIIDTQGWYLYFKPVENREKEEIRGREERGVEGGGRHLGSALSLFREHEQLSAIVWCQWCWESRNGVGLLLSYFQQLSALHLATQHLPL